MALDGTETLQVLGQDATGRPAATTETTTTQDIANLGANGGNPDFDTVVLNGSSSGTTTVKASAVAGTTTQTFPAVSGTVASTSGSNLFIADVKKCTAQTDSITTVLANVTGLTGQALVAGATYRFRCVLPGTADGTSGISYAFNYTTATLTSIESTSLAYTASAVAVKHVTSTTTQALLVDDAAIVILAIIEGTMVVNAAGTVALQIATHTGTTTCSCYVGASMEFVRIA